MELSGRVAVVTGASRGLGAGVASELVRLGLRVGMCAREQPVSSDEERVVAVRVDVTDGPAVERFAELVVARFGAIDLWINNAGVLDPIGKLGDASEDELRRLVDVNVVGVFNGTRAFVRHLRRRGGQGVLINLSSGAGRYPLPGLGAYGMSKAAVDLLTQCVQLEEKDAGLRAYAVAPGLIETDMQARIRAATAAEVPLADWFRRVKDANAFSSPEFVARALLALAFDPRNRDEPVIQELPSEKRLPA